MIPLFSHIDDDTQTALTSNMNLEEFSMCPPPLGLKLTVTPEMLQLTEHEPNNVAATTLFNKVEKLKAVHIPLYMLRIGFFKIEARYPSDLVVKCYYAKRKLVWEILHDGLKNKIEVQWRNISAIRAVIEENSPGILEIELEKVPSFFREIEPKPGKHTMWNISQDFTDGQASKYRRHYLEFPPGALDKHYVKLLQSDHRLFELSHRPFRSSISAYFDSEIDQRTTHISFGHGSKTTPASEQEPVSIPFQQFQQTSSIFCSTTNEETNNQIFLDPMPWGSQGFHCASNIQQTGIGLNNELPDDWLRTNKNLWNARIHDSEQHHYESNVFQPHPWETF